MIGAIVFGRRRGSGVIVIGVILARGEESPDKSDKGLEALYHHTAASCHETDTCSPDFSFRIFFLLIFFLLNNKNWGFFVLKDGFGACCLTILICLNILRAPKPTPYLRSRV